MKKKRKGTIKRDNKELKSTVLNFPHFPPLAPVHPPSRSIYIGSVQPCCPKKGNAKLWKESK